MPIDLDKAMKQMRSVFGRKKNKMNDDNDEAYEEEDEKRKEEKKKKRKKKIKNILSKDAYRQDA